MLEIAFNFLIVVSMIDTSVALRLALPSVKIHVEEIKRNNESTFQSAATRPLPNMAMRYGARGGSSNDSINNCQNLLKIEPGTGKNQVYGKNSLQLKQEPLEPVHIFYRFTGTSRHDTGDQHTPLLGAISFLGSLERLSEAQRGSVNLYVFLDPSIQSDGNNWWIKVTEDLGLESVQVLKSQRGNIESYDTMLQQARKIQDSGRAILFFLEEDYLCHPDMMQGLLEFWSVYNPCFVAPYDYPDRYARKDNKGYGQEAILKTPMRHWRTVESVTVTFVTRLDIFQTLDERQLLPHPMNDRGRAREIRKFVGIWAPMPSLASHRHNDGGIQVDADFDYVNFEKMLDNIAQQVGYPPH